MGVWIEILKKMFVENYLASLPLWECGLKSYNFLISKKLGAVTPLVGVWIEIRIRIRMVRQESVTPLVGVWIEIKCIELVNPSLDVTPLVGVWIEIAIRRGLNCKDTVTPLVGVWIEIKRTD